MNNEDYANFDSSIQLLERLCLENGVSSDEDRVLKIILNEIEPYIDHYEIDNLKNLIVYKKGRNKPKCKVMVSAHMDEVGFIITDATDEGLLMFENVGGIDVSVICGKGVRIGKDKIAGVIGVKPIHLLERDEKGKYPSMDNLFIDIGAKSKDEALKHVSLGDFACFDSIFDSSNDIIRAKALDNRAGCLAMINMIKSDLEYDTIFSFVTQEEIGLRGAKAAAYAINPDIAIVLEATTAADIPDTPEHKKVCCINEGAVISFMDKRTVYDRDLYNMAINSSEHTGVKVQAKRAVAGGNDAGAIQSSRAGVKVIAVSVPCRYLHSPIGIISKKDLYAVQKTAIYIAKQVNK